MKTTQGTILCIINMAPYSRTYFEALEKHLIDLGYNVVYAIDSHFSDVVYSNGKPLHNAFYFTDFCASYIDSGKKILNEDDVCWKQLFPDFDRFITIDIPLPLKKKGPLTYQNVPSLLKCFFREVFDKNRIDAVLYEQVSNSFALMANEEARLRKVPFLSIAPSRISGRIEISHTGALMDYIEIGDIYKQICARGASTVARRLAIEYVEKIQTHVPDYMKKGGSGEVISRIGLFGKYFKLKKLRHFWLSIKYSLLNRSDVSLAYMHGSAISISVALFKRSLRRRFRFNFVTKYYSSTPPLNRFFLYPLHYHPESSTSVLSPDFVDELNVIKSIAFRLPAGMTLVVKEHPSAIALQPINFYKQLNSLPNVDLLAADLNSKELAMASAGVICLTSTLGFEAAAINKPVICLGDVFYGYFPNVRMIENYRQLEECISWALNYKPVSSEDIYNAVSAYVEYTTPGFFGFEETCSDPSALKNIATIIKNSLEINRQDS